MTSTNPTALDPWGPISGILFGLGNSDAIQRIVESAGLAPNWALTQRERYSHSTRIRAFKDRVEEAYFRLPKDKKDTFMLNVARLLGQYNQERLNELLQNIGWIMIKDRLVHMDVLNPSDLANLPKASHDDLTKAADRLPSDISGAITSACAAVESVCNEIYEKYPDLGEADRVTFQAKVNAALKAVGALEHLRDELLLLGWEEGDAHIFYENLKGAINQAANVMERLRSKMGDVHGSKPSLAILAFDSIKWAMIITSLLREEDELE
ncbi:MAG: hypothetical protein ACYSRP_09680 [Planctomycetota bacterium]|jgi:hypothetical protein